MADRTLPHNLDAEQSLLGSLILDPSLAGAVDVAEGDFYDHRHRSVFAAVRALAARGSAVDAVTLEDALTSSGRLESVGGLSYLSQLALATPTARHVEHYAAIVRSHAVSRRVALACSRVLELCYRGDRTGDQLLAEAAAAVSGIQPSERVVARAIGDVVDSAVRRLGELEERRARGDDVCVGIPTGHSRLDVLTGGLAIGTPVILCARPGMGKSTVLAAWMGAAAARGYPGVLFTNEDSAEESFALREVARASGVETQRIRSLSLDGEEWRAVWRGADKLRAARQWYLVEAHGLTHGQICSVVRRLVRERGVRWFAVDYLQNLPYPSDSEDSSLRVILQSFGELIRRENLAGVLVSQLNRELEKRPDKRPKKSDLRGSGNLEQLAKLILGLYYEPEYYDWEDGGGKPAISQRARDAWRGGEAAWRSSLEALVLKNHNGETERRVRLYWDRARSSVTDSAVAAAQEGLL